MRRRAFLGAAAAGGLSGCVGVRVGYQGGAAGDAGSPTAEVDLPVPRSEMRQPLPRDHIPAVVEPAFAPDWSGLEAPADAERPLLPDSAPVVGVERDGGARAYPLRILDRHEVVNDTFGGPLLVTYCPLCGSAVVAERDVRGDPTTFGVSGMLWRSDLVLYDRATGSLWSQLLARAIRGPLTGERLSLVPARLTTWGEWRAGHPGGEVLLPPPRSNTVRGRDVRYDYFEPKYGYEDESGVVGYSYGDDELEGRTLVLGLRHGGAARAYPYHAVSDAGVVNDRVGGRPVVVAATPGETMIAWDRRVGGETRHFVPAGADGMRAAGTRWNRASGRGVEGRLAGTALTRANELPPMFWSGWRAFNPDTSVYGG